MIPPATAPSTRAHRSIDTRVAASLGAGAVLFLVVGIAACRGVPGSASVATEAMTVAVTPLGERGPCSGTFVAHELDHITRGPGSGTSMLDGTGSGLAVGDLDADGLDDLVLANLSGATSIFWNRGGLRFEREDLIEGRFRQAIVVDVDGDALNDIVLTTGLGRPVMFVASRAGEVDPIVFERAELAEFDPYTFAMTWGDLDGDGDLDAVTGSYNAELTADRRIELGDAGGVSVITRTDAGFARTHLTRDAQALAVRIADLDNDGAPDIHVGNDLATPDQVWLDRDGGWQRVAPFGETTYSTMGIDGADFDNDGQLEIFATDMQPLDDRAETMAAYVEVQADLDASPKVDDIQRPENVLLDPIGAADGAGFRNDASELGIDATGWSWSGTFGDLDNDGHLDLFVVNGMVAHELFAHLPDDALVEPNQAFRQTTGGFVREPDWQLDDTTGGRGMAMADLDRDGDLDIVVNNFGAASRVYENRLCADNAVTVNLEWTDTANHAGIGSTIEVVPTSGPTLLRTIEATRGYLTGVSTTVHFGLGDYQGDLSVRVRWPDGETSRVDGIRPDHHLTIARDSAGAAHVLPQGG